MAWFDDLQTFTPGLTASPNPADSSGLRLSIRGIGQDDPQIGLDATVGLYVNGVYIGKTPGLAFDTPDLERIEVLKGPQGTLYGRNAVAGAINIITKGAEIGGEFSGNATIDFGNFDQFTFKGAVNIPLGDTAAIKVSGLTSSRDGYVENVPAQFPFSALDPSIPAAAGFFPLGQGTDFGGVDRQGFNLDLAWQPTPQLLIEYGFDTSQSLNEPFFQQLIENPDVTENSFGNFLLPAQPAPPAVRVPAPVVPLVPFANNGRQDQASSTVPIEESRTDGIGHRISAEFDWNEDHSTKILGAFRRADVDAFTSFFPELSPFVLTGVLGTGPAGPGVPSDPVTNPSLLDVLGVVLPNALQGVGVNVRPDLVTFLNTPFDPPFFSGPFVSFGSGPSQGIPTLDNHEQFSIELTHTGSIGDRIDFTGGLFYFDEDTAAGSFDDRPGDALGLAQLLPILSQDPNLPATAGTLQNLGVTAGTLQALQGMLQDPATDPATIPALLAQVDALSAQLQAIIGPQGIGGVLAAARSPGARIELDTQAFAAYGEVTVQLTDQFSVTGGLRYSRDKKEAFQQGFSPFFVDTTDLLGNPIPALTGDETFDSLDPKVVVEYTPTDDLLIYASYSQAFRSGGFNQASVNLDDFVFDEERIRSGEIGVKSDWFNNRIRLNANVFASFVDDQQFTFTNPAIPVARFIENNDAEFIGFEIDGQFVVGDYMTASFSYAFLDAEADEFINPFTGDIVGGVDNAPRNSYTVNLDYVRPIGIGELAAHLGFNHKDATTVIGVPRTNSNLLDARLGYTFGGDNGRTVTVFAYGQNLTDDEYTIDALDVLSPLIGATTVFGQPRTYGGGVSVTF